MSDRWQSGFPPLSDQEPVPVLPQPPVPWWKRRVGARIVLHATSSLVVAATLTAAAVHGYQHPHRSAPPPSPPSPPAAAESRVVPVYGDPTPAALEPEHGNAAARSVCVDETRPLPTSGVWKCHSSEVLDAWSIGRRAKVIGTRCTHRVADAASGVWNCWTRIPIPAVALGMPYAVPVMFGHVMPAATQGVGAPPRICRAEARSSETHGMWTCVSAQQAPDGWRLTEPVDPGGRCTYRVADEETGVWSCQSASAQDARASGG